VLYPLPPIIDELVGYSTERLPIREEQRQEQEQQLGKQEWLRLIERRPRLEEQWRLEKGYLNHFILAV
jgi:hypothetical protein